MELWSPDIPLKSVASGAMNDAVCAASSNNTESDADMIHQMPPTYAIPDSAIAGTRRLLEPMQFGVIFLLIALYAFSVSAAKPPLTPELLREQASHVVSGMVIKVTSQTRKSIIEKGLGIHRDRIFKIQLMVSAVLKGEDVKPGDRITIEAWQPFVRIPPLAGLQGHSCVPQENDFATFFLKQKDDKPFEPLLPNGIFVVGTSCN